MVAVCGEAGLDGAVPGGRCDGGNSDADAGVRFSAARARASNEPGGEGERDAHRHRASAENRNRWVSRKRAGFAVECAHVALRRGAAAAGSERDYTGARGGPAVSGGWECARSGGTGDVRRDSVGSGEVGGREVADFHIAQVNIGRVKGPMDSAVMYGFASRLDEINALADCAPGFVWRLQASNGNATDLRPFAGDDTLLMNMSVW